jgi:hypothetical protein
MGWDMDGHENGDPSAYRVGWRYNCNFGALQRVSSLVALDGVGRGRKRKGLLPECWGKKVSICVQVQSMVDINNNHF